MASDVQNSKGGPGFAAAACMFFSVAFGATLIALWGYTLLFDVWQIMPETPVHRFDIALISPIVGLVAAAASVLSAIRNRISAKSAIIGGSACFILGLLLLAFV